MKLSSPSPPPSRLTAVLGPPRPRPPWSTLDEPFRGGTDPATAPIPLDEGWADVDPAEGGPIRDVDSAPRRSRIGRVRAGSWWDRIRPLGRLRARVDPGRPGATALALVAITAAVLAAVGVWWQRPQAQPVSSLPTVVALAEPAAAGQPAPAGGPEPSTGTAAVPEPPAAPLVVNVSGKVRNPGLVEVPAGARVADAVAAAGGALPGTDLTQLNLARRVGDGEQVAVGVPAAPDAAPSGGPAAGGPASAPGAAGAPAGTINLNLATADQLDGLPGIGPVTVQRILDWRTRNGRFAQVEQLREIEGIGERRFAQLRALVTV